jgi:hypothetical protein
VRRSTTSNIPELVPVLSRGKHRSARRGACFMEMASYLAGERWSDHPSCTHALVASAARLVNDNTSDENRSRLADLIPSVVGLTTTDPRADVRIALRCATSALPVAPAERQNVMAVSVLASERALALLDGREPGALRPSSVAALETAPRAAAWAREFVGRFNASADEFQRSATPHIVRMAVESIVESAAPDSDEHLHALLVGVIEECAAVREDSAHEPNDSTTAAPDAVPATA